MSFSRSAWSVGGRGSRWVPDGLSNLIDGPQTCDEATRCGDK